MAKKKTAQLPANQAAGHWLHQQKEQFLKLMPTTAQKERIFQILLREVGGNPDLAKCSQTSIIDAAFEAAKLNLEFGGTMQQAHLVPFGNKATLIVGYRGLLALMRRGNVEILKVDARCVHEGDTFSVTDESLRHEYDPFGGDRGALVGVYAKIWYTDGTTQWETMSKEQVDQIKNKSRAGKSGPWVDHYDQMARKTVIRRLANYVPLSTEVTEAISSFNSAEFPDTIDIPISPPSGVEETKAAMKKKDEPEPEEQEENLFDGALAATEEEVAKDAPF